MKEGWPCDGVSPLRDEKGFDLPVLESVYWRGQNVLRLSAFGPADAVT